MPETTEQVSQVMALADAHDIVVVPQGGNTGFMGGATPDDAGNSILLSLRRMNRIREIDATNMSMGRSGSRTNKLCFYLTTKSRAPKYLTFACHYLVTCATCDCSCFHSQLGCLLSSIQKADEFALE